MPDCHPAPCKAFGWALALLTVIPVLGRADDGSPDPTEFFESKIRPALTEHCLECHSTTTEASGGLALDSRVGWKDGGDLGPAIVPGDDSASLLIKAIEYDDPDLEMPPDGKLDPSVIADFRRWIRAGARDPRDAPSASDDSHGPSGLTVDRAQEHWAYRRVLAQQPPPFPDSGSSIDSMIDRRISEATLQPAPRTDRRSLLRRLSFDLTGLPPEQEWIDSFLADESPLAYERLVDRLLASPHFGEHFARRWMDVVRYAESITLRGFILPQAWRYRDYLIEAYSADRPFDRMIRDQIAGDLMPADTIAETQRRAIATGFLAMGNSNLEDQDKTKLEFDHLDEQLETMGRAFLAQTIGCARCHDHKFDPIPTKDYYALAGIMRSTQPLEHANLSKWIEKPLPLAADETAHFESISKEVDTITARIDELTQIEKRAGKQEPKVVAAESLRGIVVDDRDAEFVGDWKESRFTKGFVGDGYRHDLSDGKGNKTVTFQPASLPSGMYEVRMSYSASHNRARRVPVRVFSANESETIFVDQQKTPPEDGLWISLGVFPFEQNGQGFVIVSNENTKGAVIVDAIQFLPVKDETGAGVAATDTDDAELEAVASEKRRLTDRLKRLQSELDARPKYLTVAERSAQSETAVRIRGNVHQLGEPVPRGFLTAIAPSQRYADQIGTADSGRVQLAAWIADSQNPLTARVYANRVWCWLIGEGIVASENNFGTTGIEPTHPELLDYLASELIRHGWSTKHLARTIVLSETYQRSVGRSEKQTSIDPGNRLCAGGNLKRVTVESLRDAMLVVSGELDRRRGGSTIRSGTRSDYDYHHDLTRRSVYLPVFRNSLPALFERFDFADSSVSVGQRSRSTVAPQSLAMMNHPWVIRRAERASETWRERLPTADQETVVRRVFADCFRRPPDPAELAACLEFLADRSESENDALADLIQSFFASIDFRYLD